MAKPTDLAFEASQRLLTLDELNEAALAGTLSAQVINEQAGAHERLKGLLFDKQKKEEERKLRVESIKTIEKQEAMKELEQASCTHLNPRGAPRVGGQKIEGQLYFICQNCQKEWNYAKGERLPPFIEAGIEMDRIGGVV